MPANLGVRSVDELKDAIRKQLCCTRGHDVESATPRDWWIATCMAVREPALEQYTKTLKTHRDGNVRRVYYLSLEYLLGKRLENNLRNLQLFDNTKDALASFGIELEDLFDEEPDMGLGNGGLGRLAACFLDSLATLDYPAIGYGIHYEFGLFRQEFRGLRQYEHPDEWVRFGNPWEIIRPEYAVTIPAYGHVEKEFNDLGEGRTVWKSGKEITGVPHDIPIIGYGNRTVNFLRLWEAKSDDEFDLHVFNSGGYSDAVRDKVETETISKVLYPNDETEMGKELRLLQQYFFVACSLRDAVRRFHRSNDSWDVFPDKVAIQLNDTHPAVAVAELMRLLLDEERLTWDRAWGLCQKVFSYTNHTLLPEALERWSVPLFQKVLPRHMEIIFEINRIFLEEVVEEKWPGDQEKKAKLSLIEEGDCQMIRMAALSVLGSHTTNGVAALHSELIKEVLFPEFFELFPERFQNKTNGITPRRWLKVCNPSLSSLIDEKIGADWPMDLDRLRDLEKFADDSAFQDRFMAIKRENKEHLAELVEELCGVQIKTNAIYDVQIKRLHEYKRQHLNLLHILALYRRIISGEPYDREPRVFIFGAKAAPGYALAKEIIHAINAVGEKINNDPRVGDLLKVAFLPNYRITIAEKIIPAADLSEQISTAGKEASGTGNMKLALNGALTIGTLDGANVEIEEEVGSDNIFIFGKTVDGINELKAEGYSPQDYYWGNEELRAVIEWLESGYFTDGDRGCFNILCDSLKYHDPYFVLADFAAYVEAQEKVDVAYRDAKGWAKKAILNTARVGKFSSDRTIREYANEIWDLDPVKVQ